MQTNENGPPFGRPVAYGALILSFVEGAQGFRLDLGGNRMNARILIWQDPAIISCAEAKFTNFLI